MNLTDQQILEFRKIKIGILVRNTLPKILQEELITELGINQLEKEDYSKLYFDVNYPILKRVDLSKSITENRTVNDYTRYYADPIKSYGNKYLITSEWYDRSLDDYIRWLKRKF